MTPITCAAQHPAPTAAARFLLTFLPLHGGRAFSFPCDAAGLVMIDTLSEASRANYLLARTLVGRDYQGPMVGPELV